MKRQVKSKDQDSQITSWIGKRKTLHRKKRERHYHSIRLDLKPWRFFKLSNLAGKMGKHDKNIYFSLQCVLLEKEKENWWRIDLFRKDIETFVLFFKTFYWCNEQRITVFRKMQLYLKCKFSCCINLHNFSKNINENIH